MQNNAKKIRKLDLTKQLFDKWRTPLLSDKEAHTIFHQICHMLWGHAWYRTLNQCVLVANQKKRIINSGLWEFMTCAYVDLQTLAIRKLTDIKDNTNSLKLIVKDFETHACEINREGYLYVSGPFIDLCDEEVLNRQFDLLRGSPNAPRLLTDVFSKKLFSNLIREMDDSCGRIRTHVNKFVAHADQSKIIKKEDFKISFSIIEEAQKTICQVYSFCSTNLYGHAIGNLIPVPQYSLFKGLENAFITDEDEESIDGFWEDYNEKINQWSDYNCLMQKISEGALL